MLREAGQGGCWQDARLWPHHICMCKDGRDWTCCLHGLFELCMLPTIRQPQGPKKAGRCVHDVNCRASCCKRRDPVLHALYVHLRMHLQQLDV